METEEKLIPLKEIKENRLFETFIPKRESMSFYQKNKDSIT